MAQTAPFALALLAMIALAAGTRAQPAGAPAPPAYLLAELTVTDPDGFARDYGAHVARIAAAHGGEFLARGGQAEALEGRRPRPRVVILRFPSMAAARAFWTSPDYKAIAPARQRTARTRAWLVEGLPPAPAAMPAQMAPASDPAASAAP